MKKMWVKTVLIAGLAGASLFCGLFLVVYALLGMNPFMPDIKAFDFFVYFFVLLISVSIYRFRFNQGFLNFNQGFLLSLSISLGMLLFSLGFEYIFMQTQPEAVKTYAHYEINEFVKAKEKFVKLWNQQGKKGAEIFDQTLANYQKLDWNSRLLWSEIQQKIFISLVLSLILAVVLRRKR
jgi:hypothetical protein